MKFIKEHWRRYIISSLITFLAGAAIEIVPLLNELTVEAVRDGALIGILFVAIRAGFKAVIEAFIGWYGSR